VKIYTRQVGPLQNNVFVVTDDEGREGILVDPAWGSDALEGWVKGIGCDILAILDTHGHFDHCFENALYRRLTGAKLVIHRDDNAWLEQQGKQGTACGVEAPESPPADENVRDAQVIKLGGEEAHVFHCPGHTEGSTCLYVPAAVVAGNSSMADTSEKPEARSPAPAVLTGDALFRRSIGRTDLPGGDFSTLIKSIHSKILTLPDETLVLPGHNDFSTVGEERQTNPFLTGKHF
jgi:glyoxylase-like metal-dependent hydrolase (beta-lactamase superfamily II)